MNKEEKLLPMPENIQVEEDRNSLIITYKWSKMMGYALIGFSLFWNSIIYFGFITGIESGESFILFFMIPFILAGFFVFYYGLANIFNSTTITVGYDNVSVKIAPLFWSGSKEIFKHDIKQLYVKQHIHKGKNSTTYSYSVNLIDKSNKDIELVSSLPKSEEGRFIEAKMEKFLKIEDTRVSGEYDG